MVGRPSFSPVSGEPGGIDLFLCYTICLLSPYLWPGSGNENFPKRRHFLSYMEKGGTAGVYDSNSTLSLPISESWQAK